MSQFIAYTHKAQCRMMFAAHLGHINCCKWFLAIIKKNDFEKGMNIFTICKTTQLTS